MLYFIRKMMVAALVVGGLAGHAHAGELNFDKWRQLRPGLTLADVLRIMGEPEHRPPERAWDYAVVVPAGPAFPRALAFRVWFNHENVITSLESPFGSQPPRRGVPGTPQIFAPQPNAKFSHYPRLMDVRWHPVTGTYPISYQVEFEHGLVETAGTKWIAKKTLDTSIPYLSLQFSGAQPGRVRVRAINAEGTGPWSEYTLFAFAR